MKSGIAVAVFLLFFSSVKANEAIEKIEGVTTVNSNEALELFHQGALFIDVRNYSEWIWGHVEGAMHLDLRDDFNEQYMAQQLESHKAVVLYCDSPLCFRSAVASFLISMWGFNQVYYFREGYYAWLARDYPSEMLLSTPSLRTAYINQKPH